MVHLSAGLVEWFAECVSPGANSVSESRAL